MPHRSRAALLLCTLLAACGSGAPPPAAEAPPRPVYAVAAETGPAWPPIVAHGRLAARREAQLSFKLAGVIRSIAVQEGDAVRAGELLAELETTEIDAAVTQARAAHAKALRDLERGRRLHQAAVITREQLDDLQTAETAARAALRAREYDRGYAVIRAPADGRVLRRLAEPRELVQAGAPVLVLSDGRQGHVLRVALTDRDAVRVQPGDAAEVRLDAFAGRAFAARVSEVGHAPDPRSGSLPAEVALADDEPALSSGLIGSARIAPADPQQRSYLPLTALVEGHQQRMRVFLLGGDSVAHAHEVAVAFVDGPRVALRELLPAGSRVITEGAAYLRDGERVQLAEAPAPP